MCSLMFADEPIALITKSRGDAKYKILLESKYSLNAKVNTPIFHSNRIQTKAKSFARIVYLDDRSTISLYPQSEVSINGIIKNRKISKLVDITAGIVRIKIFQQITSEFKLITPHSELTCHECDFFVILDETEGERFYKISGEILVTNSSMMESMRLVNDSTIISLKDIGMSISYTSITENEFLQLLMIDANEIPEISEEELAMRRKIADKSLEIKSNIVEIRLKNDLNIERKIILTYTK